MSKKHQRAQFRLLGGVDWFNSFVKLFCIGWFIFIVTDYIFHHPYYGESVSQSRYWGLTVMLLMLFSAIYFAFFWKTSNKKVTPIYGLGLYAVLLLVMNLVMGWYGIVNGLFSNNPFTHLLYFTGFNILLHLGVFFIVTLAYLLGQYLLIPLRGQLSNPDKKVVAVALGFSVLGFLMLILGLFNGLRPWVLWPLFGGVFLLNYRKGMAFILESTITPIPSERINLKNFALGAILVIFIAVNCIGAIKAFPVGFDGAALYMNKASLISQYGGLPRGGQAYSWSLIMSLGIILFKSNAIAIMLSHLAGIFCLAVLFRIARLFFSVSNSLLVVLLFYTAPYVSFHNRLDEKVDLGFLFIALSALFLLINYLQKKGKGKKEKSNLQALKVRKWTLGIDAYTWLLLGCLIGFSFGIKYTAFFLVIAFFSLLLFSKGGLRGFIGGFLVALSLIFMLGIYRLANFEMEAGQGLLLGIGLFLPGMGLLWWVFRQKSSLVLEMAKLFLVFSLAMTVSFSPWMIKHLSENRSLSLTKLMQGKSDQPKLFIKRKYRKNKQKDPSTLALKQKNAKSAGQKARREELQRYQGFEKGLPLFLSLPYDLSMNTNLPGLIYLDLGFLWLLLIPILLISIRPRAWLKNLCWSILMILLLYLSFYSVYIDGTRTLNLKELIAAQSNAFGYLLGNIYQSLMDLLIGIAAIAAGSYQWLSSFSFGGVLFVLLLMFGAGIWLGKDKVKSAPIGLKYLLIFILSYLFLWLLLGFGVPWYAFPAFSLIAIVLVYFYKYPGRALGKSNKIFLKHYLNVSFTGFLFLNFLLLLFNPSKGDRGYLFLNNSFVQYATQKTGTQDALATFNPFFNDVLASLNRNPEEKIYRVGTYLEFHIIQNDRRVLEDNQLGTFDNVRSQLSSEGDFMEVLKDNEFKYILYDLNSASIDQTPERSLYQKNYDFLNLIISSQKASVLYTDRIVKDPAGGFIEIGGRRIPGRIGLAGDIINQGSFILFEIL